MSFFKCCVGADPRPAGDEGRAGSNSMSRRAGAHSTFASDGGASKRKMKLPNEVFFDPSKPDGQLSSITDPATASMRDVLDMKKRRDTKDRLSSTRDRKSSAKAIMATTTTASATAAAAAATADQGNGKADMDVQDNNGLTRGQNFMKVEKWLRTTAMYQQVDITPRDIKNIEDSPLVDSPEHLADPPSEKDRLPPALLNHGISVLPTTSISR